MANLFNQSFLVRTLSAVVFVAVVAGAVLFSPWTFGALMAVVGAGCLWEFYRLAGLSGASPQKWLGTVVGAGFIAAIGMGYTVGLAAPFLSAVAFLPGLFAVFIVELYRKQANPLLNVAATLGGIVYVAMPLVLFIAMAFLVGGDGFSPWIAMSYLIIVWANDTGAYLVGVAFGRHRLMERISPKKSWEGFFGGIVFSVLVAFFAAKMMDFDPQSCYRWAGLGLVIAISGVFGDLVESMFKRAVDVKDSGSIMPGHGGWLDRFDALLISVPFAFTYYLIFVL